MSKNTSQATYAKGVDQNDENFKPQQTHWGVCMVVATHGHVWVCKEARLEGGFLHCIGARIVRQWGTSRGLNELVSGPTASSIIDDPAPVVSIAAPVAIIAIIPCQPAGWEKHLPA